MVDNSNEDLTQRNGLVKLFKNYPLIITILSSFVPALLVMGYYYEYGWLAGFGLDSSYINTSVDNLLFSFYDMLTNAWGYEEKLIPALFIGIGIFICSVVVSYGVFFLLDLLVRGIQYLPEKYRKWKPQKETQTKFGGFATAVLYSYFTVAIPLILFYIVAFVALPGRIAFEIGFMKANKSIIAYKMCDSIFYSKWGKCVEYIATNGVSYKGYLVLNNDKYIALYDNKIIVLDKKTNSKIIRQRIKGKEIVNKP